MRCAVYRIWMGLMVGWVLAFSSVVFAEEKEISREAVGAFERLRSQAWFSAWREGSVGVPKRVVQKPVWLAPQGFDPVWVVEVTAAGKKVGYLMLEEQAPHRLVEFAVDAENPFSNGHPGCQGLEGVPNLQQFAVPGRKAKRVASGCVPTAAANVMGYWATRGFEWWLDPGEELESLRSATRRLRGDLRCMEIADDAGYTEDGMGLTGSNAEELARTLCRDAARYGVPMRARSEAFRRESLEREIRSGRPVVVCGSARLPHKPELSWGHALTGLGWSELEGEYFVMVRDNFYPTAHGNAVRWLRADALADLVVIAPE